MTLVENGSRPAALVAKATGLNRTTAYTILDGLVHSGFLVKRQERASTFYSVPDIQDLVRLQERAARERFSRQSAALNRLPEAISGFIRKNEIDLDGLSVTVFDSTAALHLYLEKALERGNFCAIFNPQYGCADEFKDTVAKGLRSMEKCKGEVRELLVPGPDAEWYLSKIRSSHHKVRLLPKSFTLTTDMIIEAKGIILCEYRKEHRFFVRLSSQPLASSFQQLFDWTWQMIA